MQYPKRSQYKHAKKKKYRIRNWRAYTEALRRRGDLTVWFDVDAIEEWQADKTGKPGGQRKYADVALAQRHQLACKRRRWESNPVRSRNSAEP